MLIKFLLLSLLNLLAHVSFTFNFTGAEFKYAPCSRWESTLEAVSTGWPATLLPAWHMVALVILNVVCSVP